MITVKRLLRCNVQERTIPMRLLMLLCAIVLTSPGCANHSLQETSPSPQNKDQQVRVEQTVPSKKEIRDKVKVADRLEQLAKSVPHVREANCVVIGNTAIVGIDVSGDLDRARVGTIKYSVAEALRKDPHGIHAIVTADLDIRNRLQEINRDIQAGRPVSGFANELADIIGRVMPQLPRDIVSPENDQ